MFNREYQKRAARLALRRVGAGIEKDETGLFYRPARKTSPSAKPQRDNRQMKLDFERDRPLADIFPEAYE